ncbi:GNAT family N-acetyltransferase [Enterococcus faecium]|nr:GNAT family N-acetyltransferase [Enterococcus faecium]
MPISFVKDREEKGKCVREILLDLPEWFGLPESTEKYIEESSKLPLWCEKRKEEYLGFIILSQTSEDTAEIYCMGIKKDYHHQGLGTKLFKEAEGYAAKHYKYLQVKTVDEGHYSIYDQTICFYESLGFSRLEVFPNLWDEWNPCLVLVKKLEQK